MGWTIFISIICGLILLSVASYKIAREQNDNHWGIIGEHLLIGAIVVISTHYLGDLIHELFLN